ncbi:hypothetical protein GCM10007862_07680 [Dyella lipolytica]|uniref:Uncharacterized protein n=1 Tax=Dyella lipolytica TaxID=1867835 RepID=A0ABW8J1H0_9GAMM|nr:hypothetical protein [Dyella lipolytica]GLQ45717.1 hypothetical protein GCM10007862_07680 [Dyella lipolytica]
MPKPGASTQLLEGLLAQGIDLSDERQEAKRQRVEAQKAATDTFEAVTRQWMAREHEKTVTR